MPHPTRREWLALTTAGAIASPSFAAPPRTPFGFSLYGMKALKLADAVATCAMIGYDGVELALMPGYPTDPATLAAAARRDVRKQLGDSGLSLLGLMENLPGPAADAVHKQHLDRLKTAYDLWRDLAPGTPLVETIVGGKPAEWDAVKEKLADRLADWAEVATKAGAVVAVKPHVASALHTTDGALWLLKRVDRPALRLAFDYSHFTLRGVAMAAAVDALAPHAAFVHVKDAKGTAAKFEFLLPGDGDTDYPALLERLRAARYAGPVVVEVSGQVSGKPGYDPVAAARRCYARLAPAFAGRR